jgi:trehalose/maltose hydrolase-like predicted phosphorylase
MRRPGRHTMRVGAIAIALLLGAWGFGQVSPPAASPTAPCPGQRGGADPGWELSSDDFDPGPFHNHPFVGNGYLGQRVPPAGMGYYATGDKGGWPLRRPRYDGAFVAGLYGLDKGRGEGETPREAIAAIPTWSTLMVGAGEAFLPYTASTPADAISEFRQTLYLRCGLLRTSLTWTNPGGANRTRLVYEIMAHRVRPHVAAVRLTMTPDWSGQATVTDLLDGAGARRVSQIDGGTHPDDTTVAVAFRAEGSDTTGAVASTLRPGPGVRVSSTVRSAKAEHLTIGQSLTFPVRAGRSYEFVKYVGVDTTLTSVRPQESAVAASQEAAAEGWPALFEAHAAAWADLWRSDIVVPGDANLQAWVRSAMYGLLSSLRHDHSNSIAPTGLTSEEYAGLIFWDAEIWMYPPLLLFHPDIAKSVVEYRYRTREGADDNSYNRDAPKDDKGLFYPWTSGSRGDLESECYSVEAEAPHCWTQIHLQGDIALAFWQYYLATKDTTWLASRGWPVLKGIAEFWADRVTWNADGDSYSINGVAGPDEYSNNVDDGVYTNAVAATALRHATRAAQILGQPAPPEWTTIADKLHIPDEQGRYRQHAKYQGTDCTELVLRAAENEAKVAPEKAKELLRNGECLKQADAVLLAYPLEWRMRGAEPGRGQALARETLNFYAQRTDPTGPAMTDAVHAIVAAMVEDAGCSTYTYLRRSIEPFVRGPFNQFVEARGEKAGAGDPLAGPPALHFVTGSGGFLQVFTHGLTGLRWREQGLHLDPMLPPQLDEGVILRGLHWQGRTFDIAIGPEKTTVTQTAGQPLRIDSPQGPPMTVSTTKPLTLETRRPRPAAGNVVGCTRAEASSEELGQYAEAAVDGSTATAWVPKNGQGTLTVHLGRPTSVGRIFVQWTSESRPEPSWVQTGVQTSLDGWQWAEVSPAEHTGQLPTPVLARYVRVQLHRATAGGGAEACKKSALVEEMTVCLDDIPVGIRELDVRAVP